MPETEKTKYLIIGNSAGGIGAIEAIRLADKKGTITVVSDEPFHTYSRPQISHYLAEGKPLEKMLYRKENFYQEYNVKPVLGARVTRIDPAGHSVKLENGNTIQYEKMLLATGGTPIVPPMEGLDREKTMTFTTLGDAQRIDEFIKRFPDKQLKALVIGGGLIGVSVTEALVKRGVKVAIVEMRDRILNMILDEAGSAIGRAALERSDVEIITEHTVEKVINNAGGDVTEVILDDGSSVACDMVIVAIGVVPRTELVKETDIKINRGILVDEYMTSSNPDIYTCGDVAEAFDFVHQTNRLSPIWPNAHLGGRIAGLNMAGKKVKYNGGTAMNSMKYFGMAITSAGIPVPPDDSYETITVNKDGIYKKVILKDGIIVGMIFSGDIEKSGIVYNLMKDKVNADSFKESLVADDFGLISLPEKLWQKKLEIPVSDSLAPEEASNDDEVMID